MKWIIESELQKTNSCTWFKIAGVSLDLYYDLPPPPDLLVSVYEAFPIVNDILFFNNLWEHSKKSGGRGEVPPTVVWWV